MTTSKNSTLVYVMSTGNITKTPGVCGGEACIEGTRLYLYGLEIYRRIGWTDKEFLEAYPHITQNQLTAAWEYIKAHPEEINKAIEEYGHV